MIYICITRSFHTKLKFSRFVLYSVPFLCALSVTNCLFYCWPPHIEVSTNLTIKFSHFYAPFFLKLQFIREITENFSCSSCYVWGLRINSASIRNFNISFRLWQFRVYCHESNYLCPKFAHPVHCLPFFLSSCCQKSISCIFSIIYMVRDHGSLTTK